MKFYLIEFWLMNIAYKTIISRLKFGKRYDLTGNFFMVV